MLNQDNRKSANQPTKNIFENNRFENEEMELVYKVCDMDIKMTYNHPSENLKSSNADEVLTEKFNAIGLCR